MNPSMQTLVILGLGAGLVVPVPSGGAGVGALQSPATTKAVRVHAFGGPEVLRYEDAPRPTPGPGELLVRVRAAGVNPVDAGVRAGRFGDFRARLPLVPGFDVAGVVDEVGEGVEAFTEGDDVYAMLDLERGGAYAQYVIVKVAEAAPKPETLDFLEAAGVPLVALTAQQALFDTAGLQAGQTVLIQGGSGGVGSYAIQIAKAAGARVIAVASARNQAYMKALGADVTVDYERQTFEDVARDVDVVLDTVGGDTQARSFAVLKRGGHLVSIVGRPPQDVAEQRGVKASGILVRANGAQLAAITRLFDDGRLVAAETSELPLERAREAHEQIETGHTRGKVVLVP
jgi:NADPH:quinone reductase-like Zn-dependent oxidoreductase